ncbi:MAG TPA: nuclear transport factor 2 family protein [Gaiellaceae bacterium]|nr:nuclear transport factor 2 family protein [Gaiellaceae bacterium]
MRPAGVEALERTFAGGGVGDLELEQQYASGDLAVLVGVEPRRGPVAGQRDQDRHLRVTLVFRRDDSDWRLVHRHADALVHPITMEQLSLLARGSVEPSRPATPRGEL